jgi:hypothetical protein
MEFLKCQELEEEVGEHEHSFRWELLMMGEEGRYAHLKKKLSKA